MIPFTGLRGTLFSKRLWNKPRKNGLNASNVTDQKGKGLLKKEEEGNVLVSCSDANGENAGQERLISLTG